MNGLIYLSQGKVCVVDEADEEWLLRFRWHARKTSTTWYARAWINGKLVYMHVLIMGRVGTKDKKYVHHVDEDGLNNRRNNLVVLNSSEHVSLHTKAPWRSRFFN